MLLEIVPWKIIGKIETYESHRRVFISSLSENKNKLTVFCSLHFEHGTERMSLWPLYTEKEQNWVMLVTVVNFLII